MEQLFEIIQQIYELLNILNTYTQGEREELLEGIHVFFLKLKNCWEYWIELWEGAHIGVGRLNGDVSRGI